MAGRNIVEIDSRNALKRVIAGRLQGNCSTSAALHCLLSSSRRCLLLHLQLVLQPHRCCRVPPTSQSRATSKQMVKRASCFLQLLGYACRVSCATPVLGSAVGVVGVGFASAMAGQASLKCQRYYQGQAPLVASKARRQDLLLDAMIGVALWKVGYRHCA